MANSSEEEFEANAPSSEQPESSVGYEAPLLLVVSIVGLFGNLMTWLVYCRRKYRRSNAVIYILSLAAGECDFYLHASQGDNTFYFQRQVFEVL